MVMIDKNMNAAKKNVIVLTILLSTIGQTMRWSNEWGHSMGLMVKQPSGWVVFDCPALVKRCSGHIPWLQSSPWKDWNDIHRATQNQGIGWVTKPHRGRNPLSKFCHCVFFSPFYAYFYLISLCPVPVHSFTSSNDMISLENQDQRVAHTQRQIANNTWPSWCFVFFWSKHS